MVLLPEGIGYFQEMTAMMQQREMKFPEEHTLVINISHPLIENIYQLNKGAIIQGSSESPTQEMVNLMCQYVYDLALMAQRAFGAEGMTAFVE
jgi:molecular chaperone HtpG